MPLDLGGKKLEVHNLGDLFSEVHNIQTEIRNFFTASVVNKIVTGYNNYINKHLIRWWVLC